ncbi:MAG: polynucleotide adenylyltransferase PcnB [Deltaproteobacteria bacterium]|nr:polynucleotide adenylyltransferase PcnB [Deltaproteobacteria bacterium]
MRRRSKSDLPPPPDLPSFTVEPEEGEAAPVEERHAATGLVRHDAPLDEDAIDADAAKVVRRLERAGHQAYLVGGCVRDLLLGGRPKDFDVATSARPDDVRSLFRNCRIIGRRFRLAHVLFGGGKVVEVATFRRNPTEPLADEDDDLLIRSDNVFGEAHEDALRRDFTINALFYDLDRRQVLDWCEGMPDILARTIRTIGDPGVRFREDPVRILRAVKFAARLDLGIAPPVYDAMVGNRGELARAARPRVFEEILRLMRAGAAHRSMWLLWELGLMAILLPELSAFLDDDEATEDGSRRFFAMMSLLDKKTLEEGALDDVVLMTALLYEPLAEAAAGVRDVMGAVNDFLDPVIDRIAMPRRIADAIRRIMFMVPRIAAGKLGRFARTELYLPALDVTELVLAARGRSTTAIQALRRDALPPAPARDNRRPSAFPRQRGARR